MLEDVAQFLAEYGNAFEHELNKQNEAYTVFCDALDFLSSFADSGEGLTSSQAIELYRRLQEFDSISSSAADACGMTKEQALNRLAYAYKNKKACTCKTT